MAKPDDDLHCASSLARANTDASCVISRFQVQLADITGPELWDPHHSGGVGSRANSRVLQSMAQLLLRPSRSIQHEGGLMDEEWILLGLAWSLLALLAIPISRWLQRSRHPVDERQ